MEKDMLLSEMLDLIEEETGKMLKSGLLARVVFFMGKDGKVCLSMEVMTETVRMHVPFTLPGIITMDSMRGILRDARLVLEKKFDVAAGDQ